MAEGIMTDAVGRILEMWFLALQEIQLAYGVNDEICKIGAHRMFRLSINGVSSWYWWAFQPE